MQNLEQILSRTIALDCFSLFSEKINGQFTKASRSMWVPSKMRKKVILDDGTALYRFGDASEIRSGIVRNSGQNNWDRQKGIDKIILLTNNRRCNGKKIKAAAV